MPEFETHAVGPEPIFGYQSLLELGRGGMGTVYLARATGTGGFERLIVIKRLHSHLTDQAQAVKRFLDEARVAACVRHANVVGTHQIGSDADGYFLVLDYVEGASLEDLVDYGALKQLQIPPPIVLRIALDALAGLDAVHEAEDSKGRSLKILHRDVSLQNVLVGRDGVARIADFGIAKSVLGSVTTDKSYVVGKLLYMPPEYLKREGLTPTLDIYSLGVTLWLTLTGREIWPGATEAQLVRHILDDEIPSLSSVMQLPPQIDSIVKKSCTRNPAERYQTAHEMAEAIESLGRGTGWIASRGEVAAFIELIVGPVLKRRRELVASTLSSRPPAPDATPHPASRVRPAARGNTPATADTELAEAAPAEAEPLELRPPRGNALPRDPGERRSGDGVEAGTGPWADELSVPGERRLLRPVLIALGGLAVSGLVLALIWPRRAPPDAALESASSSQASPVPSQTVAPPGPVVLPVPAAAIASTPAAASPPLEIQPSLPEPPSPSARGLARSSRRPTSPPEARAPQTESPVPPAPASAAPPAPKVVPEPPKVVPEAPKVEPDVPRSPALPDQVSKKNPYR